LEDRTGKGYKMYRCDRKGKIGGGVTICVKNSFISRERGDVEGSVWIETRDGRIVRYS